MGLLGTIRSELGQISYSFKTRKGLAGLRKQFSVIRFFEFPAGKPKPVLQRKELWALSVVKNELDVLPLVLDHLFAQGVDRVLIADNMSDDGTWEYLQERSQQDSRLMLARDSNPVHQQSEKMTYLAHLAWRAGARWIIPFDADEFWYAHSQSLKDYFSSTSQSVVYAGFHHTVPTQDSPANLKEAELVMDSADSFPGKVAFRSHPLAVIIPGNHDVARLGGRSRDLDIVHVQYRGVQQIIRKVQQGTKSSQLTGEDLSWFAPHWEAGSRLSPQEIEEVWQNISSGQPDERIQFSATGPMIWGRFLQEPYWGSGALDFKGEADDQD